MSMPEVIMAVMVMATSPGPGSPARAAILDAARIPVDRAFGRPVLFKVNRLHVAGRWAFLLADMQEEDGRPLDYAGSDRADAAAHGMVSRAYAALLRQEGERWIVVEHAIGPTDAAWEPWAARHGAPEAVFRP